ncbi:MAG: preprotein translocase subunit SecE [Clostridia bacterium]|nr:preprotein translocase subunit SecE [Clostridia bacterium]
MAEEKTIAKAEKPAKADKAKKKPKKDRKRPFSEMIAELKKVSWPTRADLRTYTICVIVFVVVCAAILFVMDLGAGELVKYISQPSQFPSVLNKLFGIGG